MVVRRGLSVSVALSLGTGEPGRSHISAFTELCLDASDRFFRSSSD